MPISTALLNFLEKEDESLPCGGGFNRKQNRGMHFIAYKSLLCQDQDRDIVSRVLS
jgi:hypothetical protein